MKGRRPRQDELDLWARVAEKATPLTKRPAGVPPQETKSVPRPSPRFDPPPSETSITTLRPTGRMAPDTPDIAAPLSEELARAPVQMDQKAFKRLKRGKLKPEARLDLHGMTLDRAHGALNRFILSSHARGLRLVLVITGKGKHRDDGGPIPVRFGVLRHQVPAWLRLPPLASSVLQVSEAHVSHGGGGAFYVYLRKLR